MSALTLLIPEKPDAERDAVAEAWMRTHGSVVRVGRFWDPPAVDRERVRVYGNDTFVLVLAEKLRLSLLSPDDRILATALPELMQREVGVRRLGDVSLPAFVKPVTPKLFRAGVYDRASLAKETVGLSDDEEVIVSEIVSFATEARAFILDGAVTTCAVYEGVGEAEEARRFAERVARSLAIPRTCVIDVGLIGTRWALVELNASWGAGLNGCDPDCVVPCIAAASAPLA